MVINLRWLVQALAFVGCIYAFMQIWDASKMLLVGGGEGRLWLGIGLNALMFVFCFFLLTVTSYLKQKKNGTLKNPIPFFEKLLSKLGLA